MLTSPSPVASYVYRASTWRTVFLAPLLGATAGPTFFGAGASLAGNELVDADAVETGRSTDSRCCFGSSSAYELGTSPAVAPKEDGLILSQPEPSASC